MKILVLSCDKNYDLIEPFRHCIEKYWKDHPEIIYTMETLENPYYKTICRNYPIEKWTKRVREVLNEIDDNEILLMMDDIFIRKEVDRERLEYARSNLKGNIAMFNLEKAFDSTDVESGLKGFKKRLHGADYEVSIMCGLWQKEKLIQVLKEDSNPWEVEYKQNNCGFDYLINDGDYIIDWGYRTYQHTGVKQGKWCREVVSFFEKEGIKIDYDKRGFFD